MNQRNPMSNNFPNSLTIRPPTRVGRRLVHTRQRLSRLSPKEKAICIGISFLILCIIGTVLGIVLSKDDTHHLRKTNENSNDLLVNNTTQNDFAEIRHPIYTTLPSFAPLASISASPSVSISASPSTSISASPSASISASPSTSISASPSASISASPSASISASPSMSISASPSTSISASPSTSISASPSMSISASPSVSISASPSVSINATTSVSISASPSVSINATPSVSISASPSVSISASPSNGKWHHLIRIESTPISIHIPTDNDNDNNVWVNYSLIIIVICSCVALVCITSIAYECCCKPNPFDLDNRIYPIERIRDPIAIHSTPIRLV